MGILFLLTEESLINILKIEIFFFHIELSLHCLSSYRAFVLYFDSKIDAYRENIFPSEKKRKENT